MHRMQSGTSYNFQIPQPRHPIMIVQSRVTGHRKDSAFRGSESGSPCISQPRNQTFRDQTFRDQTFRGIVSEGIMAAEYRAIFPARPQNQKIPPYPPFLGLQSSSPEHIPWGSTRQNPTRAQLTTIGESAHGWSQLPGYFVNQENPELSKSGHQSGSNPREMRLLSLSSPRHSPVGTHYSKFTLQQAMLRRLPRPLRQST